MKAFWFGIICAIAAQVGAKADAPVSVNIGSLISAPEIYANRIVHVTGQVDNCISLTCNLCPDDMTRTTFDREKCLGLEFYGYRDKATGKSVSDLMETAFRFATVEIDARFDPTCLESYEKQIEKLHPGQSVVCTDRASVLLDAKVTEVLSRKTALNGLVSFYDFGKLSSTSVQDEREMRAELEAMHSWFKGKDVRFFSLGDKEATDTDATQTGFACVCTAKNCEGLWPSRFFGGFRAIGNPFSCLMLVKLKVGWRILPEDEY